MGKQLNRTEAPHPKVPRNFRFPEFKRFFLKNGLEVLLIERSDFPLISVNLCIKSSALFDPENKEGTANFVSEMLSEGTAGRTSTQIADELEFIAANFSTHADWNTIHLSMNTLAQHLNTAMELFSDMLLHPVFPEHEIERVRKEMLTDRLRLVDMPSKLAAEQFVRFLYQPLRHALPIEGVEKSLKKITRADINAYYKKYFKAKNASLVLVGALSETEARRTTERYLNDWQPGTPIRFAEAEFKQPEETHVRLIHKPGSAQSELRMGHLGLQRSNPDYYTVTLLNEILGGYFLSRINMNLREKHGYTYGASSSFSYRKGIGPFHISGAIQTEHTAAAIREVLSELQTIRSEQVSEEELENARGQLIGLFPIAFETADQIANGLLNIITFELDDDYFNTFREHLLQVTRNDIFLAANKYLLPDQLEIVVTADRELVEEQLKKYFPVNVYDDKGNVLD